MTLLSEDVPLHEGRRFRASRDIIYDLAFFNPDIHRFNMWRLPIANDAIEGGYNLLTMLAIPLFFVDWGHFKRCRRGVSREGYDAVL